MVDQPENREHSFLASGIPTARQLEYQDWEMGLFLHFGIRTFFEGYRDWDGKPMSAQAFRPAGLDCDQWAATAKHAGMNYAVLVCKHHDGFAARPSQFSSYSVAHSPWDEGKGDVVREYTDACRRHGLRVGLYYSPAESTDLFRAGDANAYDEHFLNQISELLANYGVIDMVWFDGCGSAGHAYDWPRIIARIRQLQPGILVFGGPDPDYRWVGNESGMANMPNWNTTMISPDGTLVGAERKAGDRALWLPAECDCMMRYKNWFFEQGDEDTVKSLDELLGLYYLSVGRGASLLLNIGPDRRGLLPDADRQALLGFGAEIRRRFGSPFACMADGQVTETGWAYEREEPFLMDHVTIQEDLTRGESIRRYAVLIKPSHGWVNPRDDTGLIVVHEGRSIGHKAICRLPLVAAKRVVIRVTEADGLFALRNVELHNSSKLACHT